MEDEELQQEQVDPKERKRKKKLYNRIMILAVVAFIIFVAYEYWYLPNQNNNANSTSTQVNVSIVALKDMTDKELQNEISRLYMVAKDTSDKGGEYWNGFSSCASGLAIMYQNELILRKLK